MIFSFNRITPIILIGALLSSILLITPEMAMAKSQILHPKTHYSHPQKHYSSQTKTKIHQIRPIDAGRAAARVNHSGAAYFSYTILIMLII